MQLVSRIGLSKKKYLKRSLSLIFLSIKISDFICKILNFKICFFWTFFFFFKKGGLSKGVEKNVENFQWVTKVESQGD